MMPTNPTVSHLLSHLFQDEATAAQRAPDEHMRVAFEASRAATRLADGVQALGRMAMEYADGGVRDVNMVAGAFVLVEETAAVISSLTSLADTALSRATEAQGGAAC